MSLPFNRICDITDFSDPELMAVMRDVAGYKMPHLVPGYPKGSEHRKDWEVAMAVRALERFGALRPDATILGVAAGTEDTIFYLTRRVERVFATDRYLVPGDWAPLAPPLMLVEPQALAPFPFDADRLVVQHMDGRALRYPDNSFDGIFSSGSVEHFGELRDVAMAAYEMGRVLKPGGVLALSTEFLLSGPRGGIGWPGLTLLFDEQNLHRYIVEASGLELVDDLVTSASDATFAAPRNLSLVIAHYCSDLQQAGHGPDKAPEYALWEFPHLVLVHDDYVFCSVHLTLRKGATYPTVANDWARPTSSTLAAISEYNRSVVTRRPDEAPVEPKSDTSASAPAAASEPSQLIGSWEEIRESVDQRMFRLGQIQQAVNSHAAERSTRLAELDQALLDIDSARDEADRGLAGVLSARQRLDSRLAEPDLVRASLADVDSSSWAPHSVEVTGGLQFSVVVDHRAADPVTKALTAGYTLDQSLVGLMLQVVDADAPVVDLGAHVGTFTLAAAAAGCRVLAVEASPTNAALLRASLSRNGFHNVYVVNAAASDGPGAVDFFNHGPWGHVAWDTGSRLDTVRVPAVTVDALMDELGWETASFVKIDVEGSEIRTVAGMKQLLGGPDAPPVLYESNGHTLALAGATPEQLIAAFEAHGYTNYLVEPGRLTRVAADEMQPQTIADYLAVKRRPPGLGDWMVVPGMTGTERVSRALVDCHHPNPHHRAYIARALAGFDEAVLARSEIARALDALAADPGASVREAARWWTQQRQAPEPRPNAGEERT